MEIKRDRYLKRLVSFMWDGQVKVITGIRRCGKSYLMRTLFQNYRHKNHAHKGYRNHRRRRDRVLPRLYAAAKRYKR